MIRTIPSPLRGRKTVRPPQQLWKLSFSPLYFYHFLQAVPAKDVDRFGGPHGLAAAGANQLPGAAGFRRWRRGDASRYPCPGPPRCKTVSPSHVNVLPPLADNKFYQCVRRSGDAPADTRVVVDMQVAGLGSITETPVVVGAAPAAILNTDLEIPKMDHFVKDC